MALRPRLLAGDEVQEGFAFGGNTLIERQIERVGDRLGTGGRCLLAPFALQQIARCRIERCPLGTHGNELALVIAQQRWQLARCNRRPRERNRSRRQIALGNGVHEAVGKRVCGGHRIARHDALQRLQRSDRPWQPLRATGAGQDAQLDLGQAEPGARCCDPQMARHGEFEPAAQRRAVHGGDHRLRDALERHDHIRQRRRLARLAELGDVGACAERAPRAGDHDALDRPIRLRRSQRQGEPLAHGMAECIHRWGIDRDDGNVAVHRRGDDLRGAC